MPSYTSTRIETEEGKYVDYTFAKESIVCPYCQTAMIPDLLYGSITIRTGVLVFCRCSNHECENTFISQYYHKERLMNNQPVFAFSRIKNDIGLQKKHFGEIISSISPLFIKIYNQAYAAQQLNLSEICGMGYRKALEFLIKDYIISKLPDEKQIEIIKCKKLMRCINEDIQDERIKSVACRAAWLGNDETHYVRKWESQDINTLILLINLTIRWIESEVETARMLNEMPAGKK